VTVGDPRDSDNLGAGGAARRSAGAGGDSSLAGKGKACRGAAVGSTHAATAPPDATGRVAPQAATLSTGVAKSTKGRFIRWPSAAATPPPREIESGEHTSAAVEKARSRARGKLAAGGHEGAYVGRWAAGLPVVAAGGGGNDRRRLCGGGDRRGARALK